MFKLYANKVKLQRIDDETVTSGSVNAYDVYFQFDSNWTGLNKTAVFTAGEIKKSILLDETGYCTIPWEVMQERGRALYVGVYGTSTDAEGVETVVLPTMWADLGDIEEGTTLGDTATPPTPDIYNQILSVAQEAKDIASDTQKNIGELDELNTTDKSSLVNAINEIYETGGSGGGEPGKPGEDGGYYIPSVDDTGELSWTASKAGMPPVESANIKGQDGKDGKDGSDGTPGAPGADGKNGTTFTPSVDAEGNLSWTNDGGLENPATVNIKGADGTDGTDGQDGAPGADGKDGGYYTPSVDDDGNLTWAASQPEMPSVDTVNIKGPAGTDGADGEGIPEITPEDEGKVLGVLDGVAVWINNTGGGGTVGDLTTDDITMAQNITLAGNYTQVGNWTKAQNGTAVKEVEGMTLTQVLQNIFTATLQPTITAQPSVGGFNLSGAGAVEAGTPVATASYTAATLNPGSYTYGPETGVTAESWTLERVTNTGSTQIGTSAEATLPAGTDNNGGAGFVIGDVGGENVVSSLRYRATVQHTAGVTAHDNLGGDSSPVVAIAAGSKSKQTTAYTPYRNYFYGATTDKPALDSAYIRGLTKSNKAYSAGTITLNVPAGSNRVCIACVATATGVTQVINETALNADVTATFAKSTVQIEGANGYTAVDYNVWAFEPAVPYENAAVLKVTLG